MSPDRGERDSGEHKVLCIVEASRLGELTAILAAVAASLTVLSQLFADILYDDPLRMGFSIFRLLAQLKPVSVAVQAPLVIIQFTIFADDLQFPFEMCYFGL
jgi:hypothetical protein